MSIESLFITLIIIFLIAVFIRNVVYPMVINFYFKGDRFLAVKDRVRQHIEECNELNEHIEHLKLSYNYAETTDYGGGQLSDNSRYNMQRRQWATEVNNRSTYQCSASIVKNANNQPYKYLCKYFNINPDEDTLEQFEEVLNDFSAVEQGKYLLANERDAIISSISTSISPYILKNYRDRVTKELGFKKISLFDLYFPVYTFQYVSAGGNSTSNFDLEFNLEELERFIGYLADLVKFRNSAAGQRALMTSKLREQIKIRDNYTCQICSLSTADEANLLLEIDHIIPISKGGITSEDNLQVLCWKCNRSKGSRIESTETISKPIPTLVNDTQHMNIGGNVVNDKQAQEEVVVVACESDTTWPSKAVISANSTKLDMTRPPRASVSASSKKIDMTRPPRASVPASPKKIDMTRPLKSGASTAKSQNLNFSEGTTRAAATEQSSNLTRPQANALRSAKEYLEYSGYSLKGLIEQLHECDGYTASDAKAAVNSLNTDWKEQAVKSAKEYLGYSGYSRKGLIEQLHECDGYTASDANAAVNSLNTDWKEQAVKSAKEYLEYSGYSRKGLIEQLHECDDYTVDQATYGAEQAGA